MGGDGTRIRTVSVDFDPADPFERVLLLIAETARRKRADYALDNDPYSTFRDTSLMLGLDGFCAVESALFNVLQRLARLRSLRRNGRMADPANETVEDTYLDLATYACIAAALAEQERPA